MFKLLLILLAIFVICTCLDSTRTVENYTDPIWMNPHKFYADYYPRANGSIYGSRREGWDIFSGIKYYGSAY